MISSPPSALSTRVPTSRPLAPGGAWSSMTVPSSSASVRIKATSSGLVANVLFLFSGSCGLMTENNYSLLAFSCTYSATVFSLGNLYLNYIGYSATLLWLFARSVLWRDFLLDFLFLFLFCCYHLLLLLYLVK